MLVKNGDKLKRNGEEYRVICADNKCFVVGKRFYNIEENRMVTDYTRLKAFSNDESIHTLFEFGFIFYKK